MMRIAEPAEFQVQPPTGEEPELEPQAQAQPNDNDTNMYTWS